MSPWLQLGAVMVAVAIAYRPLGDYMAWVFTSDSSLVLERVIYRVGGIDPAVEQRWTGYATSLLAFSAVSVLLLYLLQRAQGLLPLSLGLPGVPSAQAFNASISFVTNTNWQSYAGETTMSHLTQMTGLSVQNFLSAAVGIAVAIALIRGFTRTQATTIGNFWSDLVRATVRILLPIAVVGALFLVSQGVVQNLHGFRDVTTVRGATQSIPGGPVASQEVIKELGTNGGGFYNANSAHPFENPNPFTNLVEIFLLLLIPFALTGTFGKLAGDRRQGYVLAAVMALLLLDLRVWLAWQFEAEANPLAPGGRRREHGGQGGPLRHRRLHAVQRGHHGHLDRLRDRVPRFLHAVRRRCPTGQHHAVRGLAGRGGHGPLRHPGPRGPRRCSSRA